MNGWRLVKTKQEEEEKKRNEINQEFIFQNLQLSTGRGNQSNLTFLIKHWFPSLTLYGDLQYYCF
jgi:hypothetical protein